MLRIIFLAPILQLLLLGYAVNTDVKNLSLDVYDYDQSQFSRAYINSLEAGDYFTLNRILPATKSNDIAPLWELENRFKKHRAEMAIIIPDDFSKSISSGRQTTIGLIADGTDANAARTGIGYAAMMSGQFSQSLIDYAQPIELRHRFLYNPESKSLYFMVPGIVATLLTMITIMLTSMSIVREREMGTLEQLMVTPISVTSLLLGKISTFAILGIIQISIALTVGVLWFGIPFVGSPLLLFAMSGLYLITTLGIGMLFSTMTNTQQQAMFMAWFFSIFSILTSGFFTPIANMPEWMQHITLINPMRYFMVIVRGIMMKGVGVYDLLPQIQALAIFGVVIISLSMMRFRKRSA